MIRELNKTKYLIFSRKPHLLKIFFLAGIRRMYPGVFF